MTVAPLRVERARLYDLGAIADIEIAAAALFPPGRIFDAGDYTPLDELRQACDRGLVWVARWDGRVVGYAYASEEGEDLHLEEMDVLPEFGRRGIGTRLARAVIAEAERRGHAGVTLTTFADLPWNGPFYARLGFRRLEASGIGRRLSAILDTEADAGMRERIAMRYACGAARE